MTELKRRYPEKIVALTKALEANFSEQDRSPGLEELPLFLSRRHRLSSVCVSLHAPSILAVPFWAKRLAALQKNGP